MEYDKSEYAAQTQPEYDEGYSEKQSALDNEIQAGGWQNLTKFQDFVDSSRRQRMFVAYQAVTNKLYYFIAEYLLESASPEEKNEFLTELTELRMTQDVLLNCLLWEHKGQLEEYMVPKEVWNLIK